MLVGEVSASRPLLRPLPILRTSAVSSPVLHHLEGGHSRGIGIVAAPTFWRLYCPGRTTNLCITRITHATKPLCNTYYQPTCVLTCCENVLKYAT